MNKIKLKLLNRLVPMSRARRAYYDAKMEALASALGPMSERVREGQERLLRAIADKQQTGARYNTLRSAYERRLSELAQLQMAVLACKPAVRDEVLAMQTKVQMSAVGEVAVVYRQEDEV